jgi:hypothetical protein
MITAHDALKFSGLPGLDMMLRSAAKLEEGQAKRAQEAMEIKKKEAEAKVLKAVK